jgi:outer membrane protein assembly factor BamE (lipoprotein component of BamABCDE complex)
VLAKSNIFALWAAAVFALGGCQSASEHSADVDKAMSSSDQNLTVGTVQREIKNGMSGAEVAAALGSPNIVTTDGERREVWVYDKISTKVVFSRDQIGASILIIGGASEAGASERQQRTLTVIIKFDKDKKVRDFAYHTSRF